MFRILYLPEAYYLLDGELSSYSTQIIHDFKTEDEAANYILYRRCSSCYYAQTKLHYYYTTKSTSNSDDIIPKHLLEIVEV